jgi:hypothetical protein
VPCYGHAARKKWEKNRQRHARQRQKRDGAAAHGGIRKNSGAKAGSPAGHTAVVPPRSYIFPEEMNMKGMKFKFESGAGSSPLRWGKYLAAFAFSLIALPAWAAHSDSMSWEIHEFVTMGSAQVKPGIYLFRAEEDQSELQIMQDGKVLATVPCHWTQLTSKAASSQVLTVNKQITQLQFAGRREAIELDQ